MKEENMKISTKNQRGRRKRKEVEVGTKEFTNGREFFFDIWTEYNKIQKNTTDDISIKRILEKYQREDEGREAGRNGN